MRSQGTRLRRKQSRMPCNLVNFISVAGTAAGGGHEKEKKEKKRG